MTTINTKIQEHILDDIFSDRPCGSNDWEVYMENKELEHPEGFEPCEMYNWDNAREIRGLMQSKFDELETLYGALLPKSVWQISQLSDHGEHLCDFGLFSSREKAIEEMHKGFSELYEGFSDELWFDGRDQWHCNKHEFIVHIQGLALDSFMEV